MTPPHVIISSCQTSSRTYLQNEVDAFIAKCWHFCAPFRIGIWIYFVPATIVYERFIFSFQDRNVEIVYLCSKKLWTVSPDHWFNSTWVSSCTTNCYSPPALSVWTNHHLVCRLPTEHGIELTIQFHSRTRPREPHRNNNKTTRYVINSWMITQNEQCACDKVIFI